MHRRGLAIIPLLLLPLVGCGKENPVGPAPPLTVDFFPAQPEFRADEDIVMILHNRSFETAHVLRVCPAPSMERRVDGEWILERPSYNVACPLDVSVETFPVRPGEAVTIRLERRILTADLAEGTYRLELSALRRQWQFQRLKSRSFRIVALPHATSAATDPRLP